MCDGPAGCHGDPVANTGPRGCPSRDTEWIYRELMLIFTISLPHPYIFWK